MPPEAVRVLTEQDCTCVLENGCDEEGDPGCAYCRGIDCEWPCPAEVVPCPNHDDVDGPHHHEECHYWAEERDVSGTPKAAEKPEAKASK